MTSRYRHERFRRFVRSLLFILRSPRRLLRVLLAGVALAALLLMMVTARPDEQDEPSRIVADDSFRRSSVFDAPADRGREVDFGEVKIALEPDARIVVFRAGSAREGAAGESATRPWTLVGCAGGRRVNVSGSGASLGPVRSIELERGEMAVEVVGRTPGAGVEIRTEHCEIDAWEALFGIKFGLVATLVSVHRGSITITGATGAPLILAAGDRARITGALPPEPLSAAERAVLDGIIAEIERPDIRERLMSVDRSVYQIEKDPMPLSPVTPPGAPSPGAVNPTAQTTAPTDLSPQSPQVRNPERIQIDPLPLGPRSR